MEMNQTYFLKPMALTTSAAAAMRAKFAEKTMMYFSFSGFVGSCRLVFAKQYITASFVFEQRKCIFPKSGSLPQKSPVSHL